MVTDSLYFGSDVSVDERQIIAGASGYNVRTGSAYIFEKTIDGSWVETAKLTASDGVSSNHLGRGVSISGNRIIVGANSDKDVAPSSGAVYIYEKINGTWTELTKLTASDGVENGRLGEWVSIFGERAIGGAIAYSGSGEFYSGAVYVYEKTDNIWSDTDIVTPEIVNNSFRFGEKVSISGDTFASTARGINAVFVFDYKFGPE